MTLSGRLKSGLGSHAKKDGRCDWLVGDGGEVTVTVRSEPWCRPRLGGHGVVTRRKMWRGEINALGK